MTRTTTFGPLRTRVHGIVMVAGAVAAATVLAACGGASPQDDKDVEITLIWNSTPDEANLPILMAIEAMNDAGYNIVTEQLEGSNLPFQALTENQGQLHPASLPEGALAADAGAGIKAIVTRNANQVVWVAGNEYEDCSNLDGEEVGIFSETGGYTVLTRLYFEAECPGIEPRWVVIPDSPLRAQAVAAGELAGTALGMADAVAIANTYPDGEFFNLPLSEEIPGIGDEYIYANEEVLTDHPDLVRQFLVEFIKAVRALYEEPQVLVDAVERLLPDSPGPEVAQAMAESKMWYANGGLAGPGMAATLEAFELPGTPDDLVDSTALDAALDELGHSELTEY